MPASHRPTTLRLQDWDYAEPGAYFVTVCTAGRKCVFGEVRDGEMMLNEAGRIVAEEIRKTAEVRENVVVDCFVVMPNHVHVVLFLTENVQKPDVGVPRCGTHGAQTNRAPCHGAPTGNPMHRPEWQAGCLGAIVGRMKAAATRRIRETLPTFSWQRSFHDRVIRDEAEYEMIATYVAENPARWEGDCFRRGS